VTRRIGEVGELPERPEQLAQRAGSVAWELLPPIVAPVEADRRAQVRRYDLELVPAASNLPLHHKLAAVNTRRHMDGLPPLALEQLAAAEARATLRNRKHQTLAGRRAVVEHNATVKENNT